MPDPIDLTGDIAQALDGALGRGDMPVIGYVDGDGFAAMSFRGSTQVHGPQQIAFWSRTTDTGIATGVTERPNVSLLFFNTSKDAGPVSFLSIRGRATVDPSANDAVYGGMLQGERDRDPERKGVAIVVDVDSVQGYGADGAFAQERGA